MLPDRAEQESSNRRNKEELAEKMANLFFDFWVDKDFRFGKESPPKKIEVQSGCQPASQMSLGLEEFS